uniref:Phosphodiesterase n=1 Tax=Timema californicum TaxID=61474 RepID=A0A7R9J747_TIMCA|nr:unnamed protein product [Timema californicum]
MLSLYLDEARMVYISEYIVPGLYLDEARMVCISEYIVPGLYLDEARMVCISEYIVPGLYLDEARMYIVPGLYLDEARMVCISEYIVPGLHLRYLDEARMTAETAPSPLAEPGGKSPEKRQYYDPEYARMEAWLDEHQDFVQDYFLRKATRQVVDMWLVSHATPSCQEVPSPCHPNFPSAPICTTSAASRGGSGATTPVRKISAHEFERGGLLKPIVNTIDGTPTFLSVVPAGSEVPQLGHSGGGPRTHRRSRHELRQLDEKELIFELVKDICNELDVRSLCHKILQNVSVLLNADRGSLFLVQGERVQSQKDPGSSPGGYRSRCLVSKLFDVCSRSTLREMEKKDEIRIPWGTGIVGYVAESGEPVNIPDAYKDDRFNHDIDVLTGYKTRTLLCMPIKDCSGDVIGVAQVINKQNDSCFTVNDEKVFNSYLQFCGIGLRNAQLYEKSQLEVKRNQVLLDLARMIFEEQSTIEHMVLRILTHTQSLIQCQRVQVLLVHRASKGSFSRVFDFEANDLNGDDTDSRTSPFESRFPINIGITGYVATTGEVCRGVALRCMATTYRDVLVELSGVERGRDMVTWGRSESVKCLERGREQTTAYSKEMLKLAVRRVLEENVKVRKVARETGIPRATIARYIGKVSVVGIGNVKVLPSNSKEKKLGGRNKTVNIPNAYEDERFDPSVDESTGFRHKSILCMAIKNSSGQIIGVIQLINKFDDLVFTKNDENFVEAFAIFCGMGIHNTHMYEKAVIAMAKQSVTLEVLSYHASASVEDAQRLKLSFGLKDLRVPSSQYYQLYDFKFDDIHMEDDDTLKACIRMFLDLDFIERFHIDYEVLCRWLLSVKKNYRNVTYHNWRHAFNVAQMMFSIITATQWWKIFGEIECMALIIACLCHDLDHRGTNNSFQIKASSPLAQLYSTSTMEHHHFDQCIMILNSQGNQILGNVSPDEYSRIIKVLEDAILSTDLAVYFRKRGMFLNLTRSSTYNWAWDDHRELLRAMTMTVCDLAAITKPWEIEKRLWVVRSGLIELATTKGIMERNGRRHSHSYNTRSRSLSGGAARRVVIDTPPGMNQGTGEVAAGSGVINHQVLVMPLEGDAAPQQMSPVAAVFDLQGLAVILTCMREEMTALRTAQEGARTAAQAESEIARAEQQEARTEQQEARAALETRLGAVQASVQEMRISINETRETFGNRLDEVRSAVAELVSSEFFEQGDIERQELHITPIAFSVLSDKLSPLVEGVRRNKAQWLEIAGVPNHTQCNDSDEQESGLYGKWPNSATPMVNVEEATKQRNPDGDCGGSNQQHNPDVECGSSNHNGECGGSNPDGDCGGSNQAAQPRW